MMVRFTRMSLKAKGKIAKDAQLTPFEEVKQEILNSQSAYDDQMLFEVMIYLKSGNVITLGKQTKENVAWFVANALQDSSNVFTQRIGNKGIGINLKEMQYFTVNTVKAEET